MNLETLTGFRPIILGDRRHQIRFPRFPEAEVFMVGELRIVGSTDHFWDTDWRHVSVSLPERYPSWEELKEVRYRFFDEEAEVIQFLPPKSEYLNLHQNCFHLWHRLDGRRMTPVPR